MLILQTVWCMRTALHDYECVMYSRGRAHHGSSGRGLIDLVLGRFDLGLQVWRRVEVFALVSGAAALYVIHTHRHCVITGIDHCAVGRVGKPAVCLSTRAVATLVFTTDLKIHTAVMHRFAYWETTKFVLV